MSSPSQNNRKKRPQNTNKNRSAQRRQSPPAANIDTSMPTPAPKPVAVAPAKPAANKPDPTKIIYPYIAGELRTIAIFGIGLIVILIVLSFIIS